MKFCSECGSDALRLEVPQGDHRPRYVCGACAHIFYQNPKIIVGCLALHEGRVLLGRRGIEPRRGTWNLPAGFMENGETVEAGALRELEEETGAKGRVLRLFSVYNVLRAQQVYLTFLVELTELNLKTNFENLENRLFALDELPWDNLAFHSNQFALRCLMEHGLDAPTHLGTLADAAF